ncbi:unnamed protein product [Polarella glacialis]|uniref:AAA ATPase AAA+ lid domain-containing protein n=1 Tax=Polarella glacialis TaxID=89957 RepID=A0A813DBH9_POLGL|nr:unnamed protein product [Polarella glacialis]
MFNCTSEHLVSVIMATNRADTLDPALLHRRQKRLIFQTITSKMNLSEEVDLEDYVSRPEKISCADIAAICQEAGMQAVRHNRYIILPKTSSRAGRTKPRRRTAISTSTATEQLGLSQQLVYRVPADGCGACCCNLLPSRPKKVVEPIEDRTFLTFP